MSPQRRRIALVLAAAATLGAVAWVSGEDEPAQSIAAPAKTVSAEKRSPGTEAAKPANAALSMDRLDARSRGFEGTAQDPFAPRSWAPPVAAEKPSAPTAPPLPYAYFGRMTEDGKTYVFLQRGERSYTVASGDVLDQTYRVDEIKPGAIILTYLPLKQKQSLQTGADTP